MRLIAFDLDNTLAESKQPITPMMADLLSKLLEKRMVAVTSGGMREQLEKQVVRNLPRGTNLRNLFLLPTSGGALFMYTGTWKQVYQECIPKKDVRHISNALLQAAKETGVVDFGKRPYGERVEYRGAEVTFSALGQEAPIKEKAAWDPDMEKREKLRARVAELLPTYDVKRGGATSIDVTARGVNKAYGIRKLETIANVPISEMLYIGDALFPGGNDEIVKETGIETKSVAGPRETITVINELLGSLPETHPPLAQILARTLKGDVSDTVAERKKYRRDTSIFERTPSLVVYPKDATDVATLVKTIAHAKERGEDVSVTARSAGTCMSGGSLTTSVVAVFTKYMNHILGVSDRYAICEPGTYYRDFEKATLAKNLILPSYPASRSIAAMGGIVNNNSGGERTLEYGKTEKYVEALDVVLSDGSTATFKALSPEEVEEKKRLENREGEIYRGMSKLLEENRDVIREAKPKVSKNSAGYALWSVVDEATNTFNLAKLITGAQGTLALVTSMKLSLVRPQTNRAMLVVFLKDLETLPEIVRRVLKSNPESFESYDDHTFGLAVRYLPQMLSQMGLLRAIRLGFSFIPEVLMVLRGGVPKLVLMAEFSEDTAYEAIKKTQEAYDALRELHLPMSVKKTEQASEKYWIVRRESFSLLRKNLRGLYAAPFIDDFVVPPDSYPEFLPKLNALLAEYNLIYTIAGHIGNGNFHIIPLMDLSKEDAHRIILDLSPRVYELVLSYGGSTTGEHNDGIIRTPYLPQMFGEKMIALFEETKKIFDPLDIFNPGKKVHGTFEDIKRDMIRGI